MNLHAVWDPGEKPRLCFWGETDSFLPAASAGRKRSRSKTHPRQIGHATLPEVLSPYLQASFLERASYVQKQLDLPTAERGPVPSTDIRGGPLPPLKPWGVDVLAFDAPDAAAFLSCLPDDTESGNFSASVIFWKECSLFVFRLLQTGCFVPVLLRNEQGEAFGRWKSYPSDSITEAVEALAAEMPGSALTAGSQPGLRTAHVLSFIDHAVDGLVRLFSSDVFPGLFGSTEEQWLKSLVALPEASPVRGPAEELNALEREIGKLEAREAGGAFRLCLRVEEPESQLESWRVSFLLQHRQDSSLKIPAEKIWRQDPNAEKLLAPFSVNAREVLLQELGRASAVWPFLTKSLKQKHPVSIPMTAGEAYDFLREQALVLKAQGTGVLVPDWWHQKKKRPSLRLRIHPSAGPRQGAGLEALMDYDWQVLVGDQTVSWDEFQQWVMLKMPLLKIRGQWVELRRQEIENVLLYLRHGRKKSAKMPLLRALRTGLTGEVSEVGLPVREIQADGWTKNLLGMLSGPDALEPVEVPAFFHGRLRPYQHRGLSWLCFLTRWELGACLADDMGLGKTVQLIAWLLVQKERGTLDAPALLICPMSVIGNWQRELERFGPDLSFTIHHGGERLSGDEFTARIRADDLVITTYSLASRDEELLSSVEWSAAVLDEAQNIKNPDTQQTRSIKRLKARWRIALTGTPLENRLQELWSIMDFLNPSYLGSLHAFDKKFQRPVEKRRNNEVLVKLQRLIAPFVLRRLKSDKAIIKDLPDKLEMKVYCNLTREQGEIYESVVREMLEKIAGASGIRRKGAVFSAVTQLKQVCNHPAHFLGDRSGLPARSGKLDRLGEMLEEALAEGDKALVFTQYVEMGHLLARFFDEIKGWPYAFLHGSLNRNERDRVVERFQADKSLKLLILSTKAGGTGLNLTAANRVFHFDRWWNPAVEDQATDRAYRIGQMRRVQVHKFICLGTLEERIDAMIEKKGALAEKLIASGEAFLTEMSEDELREVFTLSRDAVGEAAHE